MGGAMGARPMKAALILALGALTLGTLGACSSGDDDADAAADDDPPTETVDRPDGAAAALSDPLTGGNGPFVAAGEPADVESAGFVEEEFAASGTAASYVAVGELPADGTYELEPGPTADYATRILVRRPAEAGRLQRDGRRRVAQRELGRRRQPRLHLPGRRDRPRRLRLGGRVGAADRHRGRPRAGLGR